MMNITLNNVFIKLSLCYYSGGLLEAVPRFLILELVQVTCQLTSAQTSFSVVVLAIFNSPTHQTEVTIKMNKRKLPALQRVGPSGTIPRPADIFLDSKQFPGPPHNFLIFSWTPDIFMDFLSVYYGSFLSLSQPKPPPSVPPQCVTVD